MIVVVVVDIGRISSSGATQVAEGSSVGICGLVVAEALHLTEVFSADALLVIIIPAALSVAADSRVDDPCRVNGRPRVLHCAPVIVV